MTAFYMFRLLYMTFYGESRVEPEVAAHLHEAPDAMRAPLMLLALLSALGGLALGFPPEHGMLHRWLEPVFEAAAHPHVFSFLDIILMVVSLTVAAAGWHLAYRFYVREPHLPEQWAGTLAIDVRPPGQHLVRGRPIRTPARQADLPAVEQRPVARLRHWLH